MTDNQPCLLLSESKLSEIRKATDPLNPSTNRGLLIEYIAALLADINLLKSRTPATPYQEAVEKVAEMVLANIREQVGGHSIRSSKSDNLIIHTGGSIDLTELAKAALAALGIVEGK